MTRGRSESCRFHTNALLFAAPNAPMATVAPFSHAPACLQFSISCSMYFCDRPAPAPPKSHCSQPLPINLGEEASTSSTPSFRWRDQGGTGSPIGRRPPPRPPRGPRDEYSLRSSSQPVWQPRTSELLESHPGNDSVGQPSDGVAKA